MANNLATTNQKSISNNQPKANYYTLSSKANRLNLSIGIFFYSFF